MKFFIPHETSAANGEERYAGIAKQLASQLGLVLEDERIYRVSYQRGKKKYRAEVGKNEEHEDHYQVVAIYKTPRLYIIFTQTPEGGTGVSILVDKEEVLEVENFAASAPAAA
jgi:hypothetical protein